MRFLSKQGQPQPRLQIIQGQVTKDTNVKWSVLFIHCRSQAVQLKNLIPQKVSRMIEGYIMAIMIGKGC